jgi:hypothetical protein
MIYGTESSKRRKKERKREEEKNKMSLNRQARERKLFLNRLHPEANTTLRGPSEFPPPCPRRRKVCRVIKG